MVAVLRRNFSLGEKLLHARQVVFVARERHVRLFELRVARRHVRARLLDRRAGLVVRPRVVVIGLVHLRFQAGDIGFRRREVGLQFLGVEFRDQVALFHFRAFVHFQRDHPPGDLRAHDHFVAVHNSYQGNVAAPGRRHDVDHQRNQKQRPDHHHEFPPGHRGPRSPGLGMQTMIQKIQQRPLAGLHRPRREKIAAHDFAQDRRGRKVGGGHAQNAQRGVVGIDGAEFSRAIPSSIVRTS